MNGHFYNAFDGPHTAFLLVGLLFSAVAIISMGRRAQLSRKLGTVALSNPSVKYQFALVDRVAIAPHVRRLRFALPSKSHVLGLPIGKHVTLSANVPNPVTGDGPKYVARQYTPTSSDHTDKGHFDLVIKVYRKNEHPRFPEGGWMSQYLDALPIGGTVDVRGPSGRIEYMEKGRFKVGDHCHRVTHVGMIAGGTGITPMYQLIKHVLVTRKGKDPLRMSLLFGNQHPGDILLRHDLERFARDNHTQFSLNMTVDRIEKDEKWKGHLGFVNADMIQGCMPPPGKGVLILLCGPPPMVKSAEAILHQLGYDKDMMHAY